MCKSKFKITRWLLGLMVLAVIVGMGPAAYAQPALGVGLQLNGGNVVHVGNSYTGAITVTNTCSPTCSETVNSISVVPACTVVPTAGTVCSSPDAGVITIDSATSVSGCGAVTWTVTGGPGTFTLTPSSGVVLANGLPTPSSCALSFGFTVNTLPSVDADTTSIGSLDTGGSAAAAGNVTGSVTGAGGVGDTDTPFTFTCEVKVDKQISCDGGATWSDAAGFESANGDGSNGCIGIAGVAGAAGTAGILTRYAAQNTSDSGIALSSCTIGESNVSLGAGITTTFGISNNGSGGAASTQSSGFGLSGEPTAPVECMAGTPGSEPNTATVSCTCNVPLATPPTVTATDSATFGCCGVQVDKQVSCDGTTWVDQGLTTNNTDPGGTNSATCGIDTTVHFRYFAKNTGSLDASCAFTDTQDASGGVQIFALASNATLTAGADQSQLNSTDVTASCSQTFGAHEPNTGGLSCSCALAGATNVSANASDSASVVCEAHPGVSLTKDCVDQNASGINNVTFSVQNTGDVTLTSCTVTDTYYPGSPTCPPTTSDGTTASVTGTISNLNAGATDSSSITSSIDSSGLSANYCNTAHVSCTPSTGGDAVTADSSDQCNVAPPGTCITRTPGYWGTHPNQTDTVMGSGLTVCGLTLTEITNHTANSATEDLCESNQDAVGNNYGYNTSPQQLQLIRQCTAAALNLVISGNGNISGGEAACTQGAYTNIAARFDTCCAAQAAVCNSNASADTINTSGCIGYLDGFNNQFDNVSFPQGFLNESANPTYCQAATGNHWVNPGRNLGHK